MPTACPHAEFSRSGRALEFAFEISVSPSSPPGDLDAGGIADQLMAKGSPLESNCALGAGLGSLWHWLLALTFHRVALLVSTWSALATVSLFTNLSAI